MAGCETPTISAGHAQGGAQADPELTFRPDHLMGADHGSPEQLQERLDRSRDNQGRPAGSARTGSGCLPIGATHPLAEADRISTRHLEGEPLIAAPATVAPTLRDAITAYFRSGGFDTTVKLEAQLQQTIVSLVAEGLGVALVPDSMRKLGMAGVVFRNLEDAPVVEHVIGWRQGNLNPALRPFLVEAGVGRDAPHLLASILKQCRPLGRFLGLARHVHEVGSFRRLLRAA